MLLQNIKKKMLFNLKKTNVEMKENNNKIKKVEKLHLKKESRFFIIILLLL